MKTVTQFVVSVITCLALLVLGSCSLGERSTTASEAVDSAPTVYVQPEFGGKIARSYADSEEWWPPEQTPPEGAPNIIIFLLDDTGFAQIGSFGGLIETPSIDALADNGLRYNNFHTTALCSPSRATLMAGRRFRWQGARPPL